MQRPFFSQSPKRVGSSASPSGVGRSRGALPGALPGALLGALLGATGGVAWVSGFGFELLEDSSAMVVARVRCESRALSHPRGVDGGVALITYALADHFRAPPMPGTAIAQVHCIAIEGADARRFAQAQFSGDVHTLAPGHWQWNAWLDVHGRVDTLVHLVAIDDDHLLMVLRGGDAERTHSRLGHYLLRSRATLLTKAYDGYADDALEMGRVEASGADMVLGYGDRSLRLGPAIASPASAASNEWRLADIRTGWPTLPQGEARLLPPALGLERLGAVSFDKGCYPGQEIAARLHYRGGHKLRLHHLRGLVPLSPGEIPQTGGAGPVHVLDSARLGDKVEMLVAAPKIESLYINILEHKYDVISIFDA